MFWNQYPYINMNDLNLDFLLKAIGDMKYEVENFVSINAIKYADPIQWDITRQYEKNTIVIDPLTGTAYISVAAVPSGVALTRTDFWTVVFDLGAFIENSSKNLTDNYEEETTTTATFNSSVNSWLVWGGVLYRALVPITAGDTYVIGSNITHITVEYMINRILSVIGDLAALTTTDNTSIVNAINEVDDHADNANASILALIHDISSHYENAGTTTATINSAYGDWLMIGDALYLAIANINIGDTYTIGTNIVVATIEGRYNALQTIIGNLSSLTTTDQSTIVGAINEVDNHADNANALAANNAAKIGTLSSLNTTDKTNLVNAINEVLASSASKYNKILLVMDSYGSRTYSGKYMNELVEEYTGIDCDLINQNGAGVYNGDLTSIISSHTGTGYDAVIVYAGANDQLHTNDLAAPFVTMCNTIKSKWSSADIIIGCCGLTFSTTATLNTPNMIALASAYRSNAFANGAKYIENSEYILRHTGLLDADLVHPNTNGVHALAKFLSKWLIDGVANVDYIIDITDSNSTPYRMKRHNGEAWLYKVNGSGYVYLNNSGTVPFDSNSHDLALFDNTLINCDSNDSGAYAALASNIAFAGTDPRAICCFITNKKLQAFLYVKVGQSADTPTSFRIVGNSIYFNDTTT